MPTVPGSQDMVREDVGKVVMLRYMSLHFGFIEMQDLGSVLDKKTILLSS